MPLSCSGCGASVKRTGWRNHIRTSTDPRCSVFADPDLPCHHDNIPVDDTPVNIDFDPDPSNRYSLSVEPEGDLFGNYADFYDDIMGDWDNSNSNASPSASDSASIFESMQSEPWMLGDLDDEDEDLADADNQEQEHRTEPNRPLAYSQPYGFSDNANGMMDEILHEDPFRVRGGAEDALGRKPFIVKFPNPDAGQAYQEEILDANNQYMQALGTGLDNPYGPFISRRDWEVAKWAKCRGPSSTAFTDLMKIDGVSGHNGH